MDSNKLETFLVVSKYKSFSKAAEKLFITPAAVKKQIDSLESETGSVLFYRKSYGCELTKAGQAFTVEAENILKVIRKSIEKIRHIEEGQEYEIHIGHSTRLSFDFISLMSSRYNELYPGHYLYFERMKKSELGTALDNRTIDCFLFLNPMKNDFKGIKTYEIGKSEIHAVMNPHHPLAGKNLISYSDLLPYQVYISSILDTELYESLESDIGSNLHIMDKSDRNELIVSLLKQSIILFPSRVSHDVSIPFDYDPLPINFYYREKAEELVNLYHVIVEILKTETIV